MLLTKKQKIIILVSFIILVLTIYFSILILSQNSNNNNNDCEMESPFHCSKPKLTKDGFIFKILNSKNTTLLIQDITVTQENKKKCIFFNKKIKNLSSDYYASIPSFKGVSIFINSSHPDGKCLIDNMEFGNWYKYDIEIIYFKNGKKMTAKGSGKNLYTNNSIRN